MENPTIDGCTELPTTRNIRSSSSPRPATQTGKNNEPGNQQRRDNPLEANESPDRGKLAPSAPDDPRNKPRGQPDNNGPDRRDAKTQDIQEPHPDTPRGQVMAQQQQGLPTKRGDREHDQITQKHPSRHDRSRLRAKPEDQDRSRRTKYECEQAHHAHGKARDNDS